MESLLTDNAVSNDRLNVSFATGYWANNFFDEAVNNL